MGKLPNYFPLFLRSCASNPTIHWTLLTTQPINKDLPCNVEQHEFSIEDFSARVRKFLGIDVDIRRPYKLCDFRPAYGCIYPELFEGYDFWGHCDADVIFGDLRNFFADKVFENQIKVQMRGALSLFRNNEAGNQLFRLPHPQIDFRKIFESHKYCGFDEWEGLYKLLKVNGIGCYISNDNAEIAISKYDLRLAHNKNYSRQVFSWEDGRILRTAWDGKQEIVNEYSYIHLQKRPILSLHVAKNGNFCFLPDSIVGLDEQSDKVKLAARNSPNRIWELKYQLQRVPRYLRSLRTIDRYYWRVPK